MFMGLQLIGKVLKKIKQVGRMEPLVVLSMAAFYLAVVPRCEGPDNFLANPMHLQMFLEKSRLFPVGSKAVGKFCAIICLDTFNGAGKGLSTN